MTVVIGNKSTNIISQKLNKSMYTHQAHQDIPKRNNQLLVAGRTADEVVAIAGGTPCYIYDGEQIRRQVESLKAMLPNNVHLHYAIKANPFSPLVTRMAEWVDGFDVASHKELILALATGMPSQNISFAGPGKSDADLTAAIASQVVIHVESENELWRIYKLSEQLAIQANIALRVNPDFELKHSGMRMSGGAQPFGIDAENVPEILRSLNKKWMNFKGLHIFCGSQNLNHQALIQAHNQTFALAERLLREANVSAKQINIGGGFGIPYFAHETSLQLNEVTDNLCLLMDKYKGQFTSTDIHLELGRYLVGNAGIYLSRIVDKKVSRGETFLVADGGLHHHLANSGNFGQVIRKNYPTMLANCSHHDDMETVNIVGPLCTPLDVLAKQVSLPVAKIGDLFAVLQSGAYGASASPKDFLSQPYVREIML